MAVKPPTTNKATSPSKNIQRGNDRAWGAQEGFKTPEQALANKWNKKTIPVGGKS